MTFDSSGRKSYAMTQVGEGLKSLTERVVGKKSAALGQMLLNWGIIVGETISCKTIPLKLSYSKNTSSCATLYLSVKSAHALEITQSAPAIIEKINLFMGYNAINQIRLIHLTPHSTSALVKKNKTLISNQKEKLINTETGTIPDEKLREALQSFGRHLMANESA